VQVKTKAIVLSSLKFQEKLDCKMFYAVSRFEIVFCRDAFSGRKSNQKIAYFQPLTILEIEAVHKTKAL
jgi:DNA repair protein RecO (recombination protein O)